jgi:hypothetical protein
VLHQIGRVVVDRRIGGMPRYLIGSEGDHLMRVPEEVRKCVAFLKFRQNDEEIFAATVFFVAIPLPTVPDELILYAVTAKHVIDGIKKESDDGRIYFRLNSRNSTTKLFVNHVDDWYFHPNDSTIDVAVCSMRFNGMDHMAYHVQSFATDETIEKEDIGVGEDVFVCGLFHPHAGKGQNIPILRVGNIAAMPEARVQSAFAPDPIEAYLVETHSISGLSGSPVFVHLGVVRHVDGQKKFSESPRGVYYLLGLMQGHWDLPIPDIRCTKIKKSNIEQRYVRINSGIGIVVPAKNILEVLNQPELDKLRMKKEQELREENSATLDSLVESEEKEEKLFTKEDFEGALKKVSRPKPKQDK